MEDDHPGQAPPVLIGDEDLEARVGLFAAGVGSRGPETGQARTGEEAKGARVRAVLVSEGTAVAHIAWRVPRRPAPPVALDAVAIVHPPGANGLSVGGRRLRTVDWIPGGARGRREQ